MPRYPAAAVSRYAEEAEGVTFVMVMPAPAVIILEQPRPLPRVQQEVHLVLLPPGERVAQKLPGLVEVEVSGPQEAQHVLVFRNLHSEAGSECEGCLEAAENESRRSVSASACALHNWTSGSVVKETV